EQDENDVLRCVPRRHVELRHGLGSLGPLGQEETRDAGAGQLEELAPRPVRPMKEQRRVWMRILLNQPIEFLLLVHNSSRWHRAVTVRERPQVLCHEVAVRSLTIAALCWNQ